MSFFKVCSGKLKVSDDLVNTANGPTRTPLTDLSGTGQKKRGTCEKVLAGDCRHRQTKDTYQQYPGAKGRMWRWYLFITPEPRCGLPFMCIIKAMKKRWVWLNHIHEEVYHHHRPQHELKQTIINAQGEMHLAMLKWKIEHLYGIQFDYERPAYPTGRPSRNQCAATTVIKKSGGADSSQKCTCW